MGFDAVEMIREYFGTIPLMVDANAAYTLADAARLARARSVRADDDRAAARVRRHPRSRHAAATARDGDLPRRVDPFGAGRRGRDRAGGLRVINIKPGRLGGHAESIRVHDACANHGIPVWHGGMLESGIGRAHNLHLASLPNFTLPGDISASRRYFVPDLIEPPIEVSSDGLVTVPTAPGIGVNVDWDRVRAATIETYEVRA
jgi:O-succinylbenzoate synthase